MQTRKTIVFLVAALAFLAAALVVPSASAQSTDLKVTEAKPAKETIRPGADSTDVSIKFTLGFGTPAQYGTGLVAANLQVKATQKDCSPYIQVVGTTDTSVNFPPGTQAEREGEIKFKIVLKPDAPGLEALQCKFDVQSVQGAGGAQTQPASNTVPTAITIQGTYIPLIQANVANGKLKTTGPQKEIPYQLELTNFGNAKTVVNFAITNEPAGGKWEALAPEQVTLNTEQSGLGNKQTIPFVVSTTYKNGWNNAVGGYTLELTPSAFIDAEQKGTPSQVNVLARVRGVYVPGIEPLVLVGAILGTALVARLTRNE